MAFATFFARFALGTTALFARTEVGETVASSPANSLYDVQSVCIWQCDVIDSEFGLRMKSLIPEYRLITLYLKYEQKVENKCSNQTTANNSSIKLAELWTWITLECPSHGGQLPNMSQPNKDSGTWFGKSLGGQIKVGVLCSLKPTKHLNGTQPSLNDLITMELMEKVANFAQELPYSVLCYKLSAKNGSFVCVNTSGTITAESIHISWQEHGFKILVWVFSIIALCYSPAILCLFKPTEVKTNDGIKIVLHGTSPVGIRSWIANFLSSHEDSIKWILGKSGVLLLFCFGVLFLENEVVEVVLPPDSTVSMLEIRNSVRARIYLFIACLFLLWIRLLCIQLIHQTDFRKPCRICDFFGGIKNLVHADDVVDDYSRPCRICDFFGGRKNIVHADALGHDYVHRREDIIKTHLRIQPSIVLKYCKLLLDKCPSYLGDAWEKLASLCFPLRLFVVVLLAPLIVTLSCILCLIFIIIALFDSCPIATFFDMLLYRYGTSRAMAIRTGKAYPLVGFFQSLVIGYFSFMLVLDITYNLVSLIRGSLMRLPNILPVTCLIIVIAFCFWECYISYPRKYNDLAIKVYEHILTKQRQKAGTMKRFNQRHKVGTKKQFNQRYKVGTTKRFKQRHKAETTKRFNASEYSTREIPKDLFVAVCEKLMPQRESIGILLVKFILILILVFFLFAVIMKTPGTDDIEKAVGTLLVLLIPKIGEICCSTDPQVARLDNETLDKNVGSVVDKYISTRETKTQTKRTIMEIQVG